MYKRGAHGKWARAVEGISLFAGDQLDTRTGMARLNVGGSRLYARRYTVLRLLAVETGRRDGGEPPLASMRSRVPPQGSNRAAGNDRTGTGATPATLVDLARGEVYIADDGRKVHVATSDGLVSPVGTRFSVKRMASVTIVVVEEGAVQARAKREGTGGQGSGTSVRIESGYGVRMQFNARPKVFAAEGPAKRTWVERLDRDLPGPLLFNGRDLSGWSWSKGKPWRVENGLLAATPGTKLTLERQDLGDGELLLDFRARIFDPGPKGFLAVYLRYHDYYAQRTVLYLYPGRKAYLHRKPAGGQAGPGGPDKLIGARCPDLFDGQWHRLRLLLRGSRVEARVDGKKFMAEELLPEEPGGLGLLLQCERGEAAFRQIVFLPSLRP